MGLSRHGFRAGAAPLGVVFVLALLATGTPAASASETGGAPTGEVTLQVDTADSTITLFFDDTLCGASGVPQFDDVDPEEYGAEYIRCARALGLSRGFGNNIFGGDELLTRAQMAAFLVRLYESVGGGLCPFESSSSYVDVGTAFADVAADGAHAGSIACLVSLGITKGTSATTFSPDETVTGVQTALFLMRLLDHWRGRGASPLQGSDLCQTSPASSSGIAERERAEACLDQLRVVPSDDPLESRMTRSRMAVYLVGFAYAIVWRRPAPCPPLFEGGQALECSDGLPDGLEVDYLPGPEQLALPSQVTIPVVICAPAGVSSERSLSELVDRLNDEESPGFAWQSSGLLRVSFTSGGIVTPAVPWDEVWPNVPYPPGAWLVHPPECEELARARTGADRNALLVDTGIEGRDTGGADGRAWLGWGGGTTYVHRSSAQNLSRYVHTVVHELHHALLGIPHLFGEEKGRTTVPYHEDFFRSFPERPIDPTPISGDYRRFRFVGDRGQPPQGITRVFTCSDRERLGWPIGNGSPPCARFSRADLSGQDLEVTFAAGGAMRIAQRSVDMWVVLGEVTSRKIGPDSYGTSIEVVHERELLPDWIPILEPGKLYQLKVFPFTDDGVGDAYETYLTAMAVPEEVTVVNRSWTEVTDGDPKKNVQFEVTWPAVANADHYKTLVTGSGYEWSLLNDERWPLFLVGESKASGPLITSQNTILLNETEGLRLNTPVDLRIDACWEGGRCAPYARVTLPAVSPPAKIPEPSPEQPGDWDPQGVVSNVLIVDFIARRKFGDGLWDTMIELAWDPVPGASFYWVRNPILDRSIPYVPHGEGESESEYSEYDVDREYDLNRTIGAWFPESNSVKLHFLQPHTQYRFELWACPTPLEELDVISTSECGPRSEFTLTTPAG